MYVVMPCDPLRSLTIRQIRTCSGFAALLNALTRNAKGLRSTGVIAVSCRHELFMGQGVGEMQKGERYVLHQCACEIHS